MIDLEALPATALLNDRQASEALNIPRSTLNMWRCHRRVDLPFIKMGRQVRYQVGDLRKFLEECRQEGIAA